MGLKIVSACWFPSAAETLVVVRLDRVERSVNHPLEVTEDLTPPQSPRGRCGATRASVKDAPKALARKTALHKATTATASRLPLCDTSQSLTQAA